ncbi:hypothetical protein HMPREF0813_01758 [Streptococcus anginosus F0211]|uniref:Uncharacterized protein n=1 Tax=Streptococcus anginosus F0211 TaxID=706437 RepID=E6J364_STRAP|nr:hypothetical protein SanJ4206_0874c [Streptococcus anginosus]EFU21681.1 hypothetical protein HMPREF0813_01758 [Streptococcus anginosus F0211]ETS94416.1 hypothetical protein HMPREF1512_1891 [Streptococcus sp. OBRC6]EUB14235.1 hypothetical protein HMPREF1510_0276 [Streptococcus sp. ACC21]EUC76414.1 hypothetical protein HMPREF1511_1950 [Streptococcus sp. CM7]EWC96941.1 hypothetical protein HMPREF1509_1930 [Streptococcus sp. AC15]
MNAFISNLNVVFISSCRQTALLKLSENYKKVCENVIYLL